ncbi:Endonuclease I [Capnocytophaga haemolytica]|jgi:extracellular ribonuclease|uniref:Extracellular ribonuclease n=2 Tax=Capnocytophaga haemolytica TaxID=45243 RepID=A0AAX2GUV7_9FLAO|nr:Endonuclease I [Capnocytophaga haemolytica]SNV03565.1 Extracellular ribonuclease precursor [Capnocytophaga haemolytica]
MMIKKILLVGLIALLSCNKAASEQPRSDEGEKKKPQQQEQKIVVPKELQAYYGSIDFNKTGKALYDDLATLTIEKHTHILGYGDRHKYLYKADRSEKNPDNVVLLYTGEERYWKEYEGNKGYYPTTFNTEHTYPRSKINKEKNSAAIGDLHHLRVCDKSVNSSRGNRPYTEGKGKAEKIGTAWYPGDEWKGDVARMILYLNLRYNLPLNEDISTGGIDLLLQWNDEDPVSYIEKNRNNVIEGAQGNRNPFIDFPQLARRIYK